MLRYHYDQVISDDFPEGVANAVLAAGISAVSHDGGRNPNIEHMANLFSVPGIHDTLAAHANYFWFDGGGAKASDPPGQHTGIIATAWVRSACGQPFVRVVGGRVPAPVSASGRERPPHFGISLSESIAVPAVVLVFPELYSPPRPRDDKSRIFRLGYFLRSYPLDFDAWAVLSDLYAEEENFLEQHRCMVASQKATELMRDFRWEYFRRPGKGMRRWDEPPAR